MVITDTNYKHSEIAGGLEILANYTISGNIKLVTKAKKLKIIGDK